MKNPIKVQITQPITLYGLVKGDVVDVTSIDHNGNAQFLLFDGTTGELHDNEYWVLPEHTDATGVKVSSESIRKRVSKEIDEWYKAVSNTKYDTKVAEGLEGGVKHDQGKPDFSHLSYELCEEVAKVREFGAKKYARNNWKKGFKVTRSLAAAMRHIVAFANGETNDPESGLMHLGHAVCCLEHAIYDMKRHPQNDDRNQE